MFQGSAITKTSSGLDMRISLICRNLFHDDRLFILDNNYQIVVYCKRLQYI